MTVLKALRGIRTEGSQRASPQKFVVIGIRTQIPCKTARKNCERSAKVTSKETGAGGDAEASSSSASSKSSFAYDL